MNGEEGGFVEDDGADGFGEGAIDDARFCVADDADFFGARDVEFGVGGLFIDVGGFDAVGSDELEDIVAGFDAAEFGAKAAHEDGGALGDGEAEEGFFVAGGGFYGDGEAGFSGLGGEVFVFDFDVEAFSGVEFGGVLRGRVDGGADIFEGIDGVAEAAEFEVGLADVEVGVV